MWRIQFYEEHATWLRHIYLTFNPMRPCICAGDDCSRTTQMCNGVGISSLNGTQLAYREEAGDLRKYCVADVYTPNQSVATCDGFAVCNTFGNIINPGGSSVSHMCIVKSARVAHGDVATISSRLCFGAVGVYECTVGDLCAEFYDETDWKILLIIAFAVVGASALVVAWLVRRSRRRRPAAQLYGVGVTETGKENKIHTSGVAKTDSTTELADTFTLPSKLDEMQPYIEQLKEFENKIDQKSVSVQDERNIREVFAKVRKLLQNLAVESERDPTTINAAFLKFQGRHLRAYNIAHENGSSSDPDHLETVALVTDLQATVQEQYPTIEQTVPDPIALVRQATDIKENYNDFMRKLAKDTGGEFLVPEKRQLKGLYRILEKCAMRPSHAKNKCENVFDVLRGMIKFQNDKSIGKAMQSIFDNTEVVRIKQRLASESRTSEGWGDIMINFRLKDIDTQGLSTGIGDYICEVQFVRKEMLAMRKELGGHNEYFQFRAALELHEVNELALPSDQLIIRIERSLKEYGANNKWTHCQSLNDLKKRLVASDVKLEKLEAQIISHRSQEQYEACAQLYERKAAILAEVKNLEDAFKGICDS